jgi:hypothetical protein
VVWEAEVVTACAQLQRGCAALEETEGLKTALTDKATTLTAAEEQLRQERAACQGAEGQLQQERAALVEARAALEQERMAREEALGQLQRERAALEGAQATLKQREDEVSRLNGELVQIGILHEDLCQSLEEQEASVLKLQCQAEEARQSLEGEKKQVEGEFAFTHLSLVDLFFLGFAPSFVSSLFVAFRPADRLGEHDYPGRGGADGLQLLSAGVGGAEAAALETCQGIEEGEPQAGSSLVSRLCALGGHVSQRMHRALHLGVKKALGVVGSHYQVDFDAVSSGYVVPVGVEDEDVMNRVDALAAPAADVLAEDFMEFLLPDAPGADDPQA